MMREQNGLLLSQAILMIPNLPQTFLLLMLVDLLGCQRPDSLVEFLARLRLVGLEVSSPLCWLGLRLIMLRLIRKA